MWMDSGCPKVPLNDDVQFHPVTLIVKHIELRKMCYMYI